MIDAAPADSKARRRGAREEAAFVDLLRTTDMLSRRLGQVLKAEDLSSNQYNVLRILRGAPEGLACGEVANRMLTRDPDITRLLDRLEKRGLIARRREEKDRRTGLPRSPAEGVTLLGRLDAPGQEAHWRQLGHLGRERLRALAGLLAACREKLG